MGWVWSSGVPPLPDCAPKAPPTGEPLLGQFAHPHRLGTGASGKEAYQVDARTPLS